MGEKNQRYLINPADFTIAFLLVFFLFLQFEIKGIERIDCTKVL